MITLQVAADDFLKAVAGMRIGVDRVARDLSSVAVIVAELKQKPWDTTGMQAYIKSEADQVDQRRGEVFEQWVALRTMTTNSLTEQELVVQAKSAADATTALIQTFQKFAKEVLSEFKK